MTDPVTQLPESPAIDASKAINLSLGMASPLWLAFAGAAVAGSAFWWMSRWTRPENLEAMFPLPEAPKAADAVVDAAPEPAAEIAVTAAESVMDMVAHEAAAMVEGLADVDPVVEPLAEITAVAQAAPAIDTAPVAEIAATVKKAADDLTKLVGIGPKLAASLAEQGVTSFAQIAAWTADDMAKVDAALSLKGRAARDAWVAQARRLADV